MTKPVNPNYQTLPVDKLKPNNFNPNEMTGEEFPELVAEVRRLGHVTKPIVARLVDGEYQIVDGEHNWRAAIEVGLTEVQCEIVDIDNFEAMRQCHRRNQGGAENPVKLGMLYERMMQERSLSGRELAAEMGVNEGTIRNGRAYVTAFKMRNEYAAKVATIRQSVLAKDTMGQIPELMPSEDTMGLIAGLTVAQVRMYIRLHERIRDNWLDAGASTKIVNVYVGDEPQTSLINRIAELGLADAISSEPSEMSASFRQASEYVSWLDDNPKIENAIDYVRVAAECQFPVGVMDCLPFKKVGSIVRPLVTAEVWGNILERCEFLGLRTRELCETIRGRIAEHLDSDDVHEYQRDLATAQMTLAVQRGPEIIRHCDFMSLKEKAQLATYSPSGVPADVLLEAKQRTCKHFHDSRSPGGCSEDLSVLAICSQRVSAIRHERWLKSQQVLLADPSAVRANILQLLAATSVGKSGIVGGRPAMEVLSEQLDQLSTPLLAIVACSLQPAYATAAASLWLQTIGGEISVASAETITSATPSAA